MRNPVILNFSLESLLYHIANCAYIAGEAAADVLPGEGHALRDVVEQGNLDRVMCVLEMAFNECREMLYPLCAHVPAECGVADEEPTMPHNFELRLMNLPLGFSGTTVGLIRNVVHEYAVCRVLADWHSITAQGVDAQWGIKAAAMAERLRTLRHHCRCHGHVRRRLTPF